jgi:hypothetical protein
LALPSKEDNIANDKKYVNDDELVISCCKYQVSKVAANEDANDYEKLFE